MPEEPERKVAKVYDNGGSPSVGLGKENKQLLGKVLVMVKCKDPSGKGWPFGYHAWFITPGEAYKDLRCECIDEDSGVPLGKKPRAVRAW